MENNILYNINSIEELEKTKLVMKYFIKTLTNIYKINLSLLEFIELIVGYKHPTDYRIYFYNEFNKNLNKNKVKYYENFWCK